MWSERVEGLGSCLDISMGAMLICQESYIYSSLNIFLELGFCVQSERFCLFC